jgi:chromate reductase, NAD(P)H dehydrogenase (quinone)
MTKILAFAGATRSGSFNKLLIRVAAEGARAAGADVSLIDLRDFPMPLYDGDLEEREGIPEHGRRFKKLMIESSGFLISTPEYNSSTPAVLKNALDWASRSEPGEPALQAFTGKAAGLLSASPGSLGGLRSLLNLRAMLTNIRVLVIPEQLALPNADEAFDTEGRLKDAKLRTNAEKIGARLAWTVRKLS